MFSWTIVNRFMKLSNPKNSSIYYNKRISVLKEYIQFWSVKNIIDIGCGEGLLIKFLAAHFKHISYTGIDLLDNTIDKTNKIFDYIVLSAENIALRSNTFNVVIFNSVLHHIDNPELAIREAMRICKKKGTLVIIEPNRYNPFIIFLSLLKKHERGQLSISTNRFVSFISNCGWKIIGLRYINSLIYPYKKWPSQKHLNFFNRLENSPVILPRLRSHFVIVAKR